MPRPPKDVVLSKEEIGQRVRALRQARELSQGKLAAILGAQSTNISAIERGERGVTVQQIVKLARALGVSTDEVLGVGQPPNGHRHSRGFPRRMERLKSLPRSKQRALLDIIDAFLDRHERRSTQDNGR